MPLYEYQCQQCGHRFEKIQSFSAPDEKACPQCGGAVERLISAPAIQFKGAGWYVNDYAGRNKAPAAGASSSESGKPEANKDGSPSKTDAAGSPSTPSAASSDTKSSDTKSSGNSAGGKASSASSSSSD